MDRIIAYCGLVCSECDAYVATQANDLETLERLAQHARDEYGVEDATAETTMCDGCLGEHEHQVGYCATCEIRTCGVEQGVANCAHCPGYDGCAKLEGFFGQVRGARAVLDEIHGSL
jgi:hypothetical protein